MRIRRSFVVAALSLLTLAGLTGCGEIQKAQHEVGQAQQEVEDAKQSMDACAKALNLMSFTPNFENPEQAAADARAKVEEVGRLAEETGDRELQENLRSVRSSLEEAATGSISPDNVSEWLRTHGERTSQVVRACGG